MRRLCQIRFQRDTYKWHISVTVLCSDTQLVNAHRHGYAATIKPCAQCHTRDIIADPQAPGNADVTPVEFKAVNERLFLQQWRVN